MTEIVKKSSVEVVSMTDEHADLLAEFFRAVGWASEATPENVRQGRKSAIEGNPFHPGKEVPTVLFLSDGQVLGYVTTIPVLVWSGGEERRAEWIKGLMVRPEHRNGPIGFLLVRELLRRLVCPLSLTVSNPSRRLFEALGMANLGLIPNYLRLLDAGTVLKKLDLEGLGVSLPRWMAGAIRLSQAMGLAVVLGACAGGAMRLKVMLTSVSTRSLQVDSPDSFPDRSGLDRLWRLVRSNVAVAPVRDGLYLAWRYGDAAVYRAVTVREREELVGFAVVRRPRSEGDPRLNGIRVASLADLLFHPGRPEVAAALLKGAEVVARNLGADALLCSASHPAVLAALARRGYLRVPANLYFLFADPGKYNLPRDLSSWWLTRGDMNADEVF
jgi:GNAT superfamily N-acetyltransferase